MRASGRVLQLLSCLWSLYLLLHGLSAAWPVGVLIHCGLMLYEPLESSWQCFSKC